MQIELFIALNTNSKRFKKQEKNGIAYKNAHTLPIEFQSFYLKKKNGRRCHHVLM